MTHTVSHVFWGTLADEQCLETPGNYQTRSGIACTDNYDLKLKISSVYLYNVHEKTYRSIAPADITGVDFECLNSTVGLRSAGQKDGVVMLAGFVDSLESVYLFCFNSASGEFLCSHEFEDSK